MRRLIAALSLLAVSNLVFVQGGSVCPLAGVAHGAASSATTTAASGHEGHDMGAPKHDMAQPAPDGDRAHTTDCLTMGPCVVTLDLAMAVVTTAAPGTVKTVIAASDHLPRSAGIAPELPPPRA